ncbi:MAG: hypothetical protein AAF739_12610 [Pseudomonadota bacterium]
MANVTFSIDPPFVVEDPASTTFFRFSLDEAPAEGEFVSLYLYATPNQNGTIDDALTGVDSELNQFNLLPFFFGGADFEGIVDPTSYNFDVSDGLDFSVIEIRVTEQEGYIAFDGFAEFPAIDDGPRQVFWNVIDNPDDEQANTVTNSSIAFTEFDSDDELPVVSISVDQTVATEDEGTILTFTFTTENLPEDGLRVGLALYRPGDDGEDTYKFGLGDWSFFSPVVFGSLDGIQAPSGGALNDSIAFTITKETASFSIPIFDDPDRTADGSLTDPAGPLRNDDQGTEQQIWRLVDFGQGVIGDFQIKDGQGDVTITLQDTAPLPPNTTVREDVDGDKIWDKITDTTDDEGVLVSRVIDYDDGRVREETYEEGVIASATLSGPDEDSITTTFDYVEGVLTKTTRTDVGDDKIWSSVETEFQEDGSTVAKRTTIYDDGRETEETFTDGVLSERTRTDSETADLFQWDVFSQSFDEAGNVTAQTVIRDDGQQTETSFDNGAVTTIKRFDTADTFLWATVDETFNEDGSRDTRTFTFDDGRILTEGFENGITTSGSQTDPLDAFSWASIEYNYDASGAVIGRTVTTDDGDIRTFGIVDDLSMV